MNMASEHASSDTSPMGRGRIAATMQSIVGAIRVRGYGLSIDRTPSPQPSPYGRGAHLHCRNFIAQLKQSREILKVSE
jgi:hypothetical protein